MVTAKTRKPRGIGPILLALAGLAAFSLVIAFFMKDTDVALFNPRGLIAGGQNRLLVTSTLVMLAFGVPVIAVLYFFMWKFREDSNRPADAPDTKNSKALLAFAWGGPLITAFILASLMLPATQRLKPQAPIKAGKDQMTVQVVAMNWKWLFIYPRQGVATVNFVQIPVDTPVRFELTADGAPMNAFWIPNLGGMLYAMTGHVNTLNLMGGTVGDYPGKTAEINGKGYAGMKFTARVSTREDFDAWVAQTKRAPLALTEAEYQKLLRPSENNQPTFYKDPSPGLLPAILAKYNKGPAGGSAMKAMEGMNMGDMR